MADVGTALVDAQVISAEQLQKAASSGGNLAEALIDQKMIEERDYVDIVARSFGLEIARFENFQPDPDAAALITESTFKSTGCLPMRKDGAQLEVATSDPGNDRVIDRLARTTGLSIKVLVAGPKSLAREAGRVYGAAAAKAAAPAFDVTQIGPSLKDLDQKLKNAVQEISGDVEEAPGLADTPLLELNDLDSPVVRVVSGILIKALKMGASDIHIEPLEESLRVRLRIDGCLVDVLRLPSEMKSAIISRTKIMASMDIAEKRVPQDGGIKVRLTDRDTIDFRVSSLPSIYGEKIVMRVLGTSDLRPNVDALGFEGRMLELVRESLANPYGMILVTGPTGSGKTTTLYTFLNSLNSDDVNIVTAEDPVEYRLKGITQVNVRPTAGLTFDKAMKSFLRQDPDIILVGEMRDYETAAIAVKAALTGHLVFSTLHTNDAPSTVVRMVDMGIEPYLVASAVKLVVAQRLLRRICKNCKEDVDIAEAERSDLDQTTLASIEYLSRGRGCDACNGIGYKGRIPVFEVMAVKSKEMKRAITEGGTEVQVAQIAKREGMLSLTECAIDMVNRGITTLDEAMSIIMAE
ncbi:MAG: Flp pilus assembly complex ATPase component TadA [Planctomycetes bacterium]|nr:Flp pilus assembly complex ATPase component TadA [Planctomycetota bacterium]